jgi:hypothetical protein
VGDGFATLFGESSGLATDDDYELRRARTPVPTFVAEAVETQLSRIYSREVRRVGPARMMKWWSNVDGCGTSIDYWMAETVAPILLVLGQVDIAIDHPELAEAEQIESRADIERLGLDRAIASVILPHDIVWWKLDATECHYEEVLVRTTGETETGVVERYRHWNEECSTLYAENGQFLARTPHGHGRVPIMRVFDQRKPRCRNIGQSRFEGIAERQREYYNRDSELILSDTTQAHPLLQGPEDYVQADGTIPIGPSWLLPKKKNSYGGSTSYEGFDVVEFPKEGAESIRMNKRELRDDIDRDSALIRPTGRDGAAQSGLAKMIDHADGNNRLAKIARTLARTEQAIASLSDLVLRDGREAESVGGIEIIYPTEFDFYTASDVATAATELQALAERSGSLPIIEKLLLARLLRLCLPGQSDAQYARCEVEIDEYLGIRASAKNRCKQGSDSGVGRVLAE